MERTLEQKVRKAELQKAWQKANPDKTRAYTKNRVYTPEQKARKRAYSLVWYRANQKRAYWRWLKVQTKKLGSGSV